MVVFGSYPETALEEINRDLEFSGIYEDGWLSPQSEFVLAGATGDRANANTGNDATQNTLDASASPGLIARVPGRPTRREGADFRSGPSPGRGWP